MAEEELAMMVKGSMWSGCFFDAVDGGGGAGEGGRVGGASSSSCVLIGAACSARWRDEERGEGGGTSEGRCGEMTRGDVVMVRSEERDLRRLETDFRARRTGRTEGDAT